jgi:hypothetical protein
MLGCRGGEVVFHPNVFRTFARVTKILLVLLLIGFEVVLGFSGTGTHYMNEAALQITRSQMLINSAYTLEYRPEVEQRQAMRELQTVLPAFEQEQTLLLTNPSADVQDLLQQARVDYLPLLAAVQNIIAQPNSLAKPLEVNIIALHVHSYTVVMNSLILTLPRHFEDLNIQLFVIQIAIEVVFLFVFLFAMTTFFCELDTYGYAEKKSREKSPLPFVFFVRRLLVIVLVFVLLGLEVVPLGVGNELANLNQAALQRTRCETFTTSALVLAYRPGTEKTLALSDAQFIISLFQQEQTVLLANGNADVHRQVQRATLEYHTMNTAVQALIAQPSSIVNPSIINTILAHRQSCAAMMNGIVVALQNQIEQQTAVIFFAEMAIEGILILLFGVILFFLQDPFVPAKPRRANKLVE